MTTEQKNLKLITIHLPEKYLEGLETLVKEEKMYPSRSEAIRVAVRDLLKDELWGNKTDASKLLPQDKIREGDQNQ